MMVQVSIIRYEVLSMEKVYSKVLSPKKRTVNENTTKSDGSSLAMGSSEYKELIADKKGMDEFEQRAERLDDAGFRETEEFRDEDKWHEEQSALNAGVASGMYRDYVAANSKQLTPTERIVSRQTHKKVMKGEALKEAREAAAKTPEKDDDKAVRKYLPKALEKGVYDNGVTEDDFYPGSRRLNKYM